MFLGFKITPNVDCSHEIKRCSLLGRKFMTNLDRIFKSRDITLPTKICLVKAMVLPVVLYGCESWTIRKAEYWRIDVFECWCWRRLLRVPWMARREDQSVPNEINQSWIFIGRTDAEAEALILWSPDVKIQLIRKDSDAGKDRRPEEKGMTEDEVAGWHHWLNAHEFEQVLGDDEGQRNLECCSPWSHTESDVTEHLNSNNEVESRGIEKLHFNLYLYQNLWYQWYLYQCVQVKSGNLKRSFFSIMFIFHGTDIKWHIQVHATQVKTAKSVNFNSLSQHVCMCVLSRVWLFVTPWAVPFLVPLSMEFSRQEYWSRFPFPTPGDLPDRGTEHVSPESSAPAGGFFTTEPPFPPKILPFLSFLCPFWSRFNFTTW